MTSHWADWVLQGNVILSVLVKGDEYTKKAHLKVDKNDTGPPDKGEQENAAKESRGRLAVLAFASASVEIDLDLGLSHVGFCFEIGFFSRHGSLQIVPLCIRRRTIRFANFSALLTAATSALLSF